MTINNIKQKMQSQPAPNRKKYPLVPLLGTFGAGVANSRAINSLGQGIFENSGDHTSAGQFSDLMARSKLNLGYQMFSSNGENHFFVAPDKFHQTISGTPVFGENVGTHGTIASKLPNPELWSLLNGANRLPISKGVAAHEVGHAVEHFHANPVLRGLAQSRIPMTLAGTLGGLYENVKAYLPGRDYKDREQSLNRASGFGAMATVPSLFNELRANQNALKLIKSMPELDQPAFMQSARRILPRAFGTYGLAAAGAIGLPQLGKYLIQRQHRNDLPS